MASGHLEALRTAVKAQQTGEAAVARARRQIARAMVGLHDDYGLSYGEIAAALATFGRQVTRSRVQQLVEEGRRVRASDSAG
jgi:hypothetical protein